MNARFWVYANEPTKITLKPGQELSWGRYAPHEEGWSSESQTWSYDGEYVEHEWCDDGRDCDGRLTRSGERLAHRTKLAEEYNEYAGVRYPAWGDAASRQYDEYAEAAGY